MSSSSEYEKAVVTCSVDCNSANCEKQIEEVCLQQFFWKPFYQFVVVLKKYITTCIYIYDIYLFIID